jgi:hypothetical protein
MTAVENLSGFSLHAGLQGASEWRAAQCSCVQHINPEVEFLDEI